jgi:crossover junction endodeoxyribonuclease RuvC
MKLLALDPGYERLGIAVLEKNKSDKKASLLYSDCFKTPAKIKFADRLLLLGNEIGRVIALFSPEALAIESLFFNTNQKTAMMVSEARGVYIFQAKSSGLEIFEYTPPQIKLAIASHGHSDKEQVRKMLLYQIEIEKEITYDDEFDAIAVGLTCFASEKFPPSEK